MEAPIADLDGNCRANLVLLEAIRRYNPGAKLVFVGSRLQYGRPSALPVDEDHPRGALCVHAVHKNTIEEYLRVYAQLFGLRYSIARVTNPYGPGQPPSRVAYGVVNRMIYLALADRALPIYGDGSQRRDYIYMDDAASALMRLADSAAADWRAYNVGCGTGTAMVDMARAIIAIGRRRPGSSMWHGRGWRSRLRPATSWRMSRASDREVGWAPRRRCRRHRADRGLSPLAHRLS